MSLVKIPHTVTALDGPQPAASGSVYVYQRGTSTQTTVYSSGAYGAPLAQPLTIGSPGQYVPGWVEPGRYDLYETVNGRTRFFQYDLISGSILPFVAPTLINSWADFGGIYAPSGYLRTSHDTLLFRGTIRNGTISADAFVMPSGLRPAMSQAFMVVSNSGPGRVDFYPNGSVTILSPATNTLVSLDGIEVALGT